MQVAFIIILLSKIVSTEGTTMLKIMELGELLMALKGWLVMCCPPMSTE